jgi:hypothetical protein
MASLLWTPNTAFTTGQVLVNGGFTYTVTANFTSGATFDGANLAYALSSQALFQAPQKLTVTDTDTGLPVDISIANGALVY